MPTVVKNDLEFQSAIRKGKVLVDFYAEWCGPCKMQGPVLDNYAKDPANAASIVKLDVDALGKIAEKYNVYSIPTLILFKDGVEVARKVGFLPLEPLKKFINSI